VLLGRGLCDGLITRPGQYYRLWRVVVCDQETSNDDVKARYGAVKNTTERAVTPGKQTNKRACYLLTEEVVTLWVLQMALTVRWPRHIRNVV